MESNFPATNKLSILSIIFAMLILLSCCGGVIPIPLTGFVCFPLAILLSLVSVIISGISLRQIRASRDEGSFMAWTGLVVGGSVSFLSFCFALLLAAMFIFAPDSIPNPPYINQF